MKKNVFVLILSIVFSVPFFAQESNIFHDRNFWKANPSIQTIEKHIAEGNDITSLNSKAFDAVTWALIEKTDNETVKYLLTKKGNGVNKLTHDGRTYIFWAAYKSNLEMMVYLVDNGAKTDIIDDHGNSVMNFAASTGQTNSALYDFLFKHGADINKEKTHNGANALLLIAPYVKDLELVDYFISKGASLNTTDNNGNGIFNYVAKGGNIEFLKHLIDKGVTYKAENPKGGNAVIMASQGLRNHKNGIEVYRFLEDIGLQINSVGFEGRNPLHRIAYYSDDEELFDYFIKKGVDVNLQDDGGDSPFMNAANSNTLKIVKHLFKYVNNINAQDENGRSALTMAVNRNSDDVVQFLIDKGADIKVVDTNGNSLMYYLMNTYRSNNPDVFEAKLKALKSAGLNVNETQGSGKTLYHIAAEKNNVVLIKRVSKFDLDINKKNDDGLTALHIAAMKAQNQDILKTFLEFGADKSIKTDFEESVFDLATENELLQEQDIDISFLNK